MNNVAKRKLQSGQSIVGAFVAFPHPDMCEWLAHMSVDWLIPHVENGPLSFETNRQMARAMKRTDRAPVARLSTNNDTDIKRILDLGASGIDASVIGPFDLPFDMGCSASLKSNQPRHVGASARLAIAAQNTSEAAGTVTNELDRIPWLMEVGQRAILVGEADAFPFRSAKFKPDAARNPQAT